MVPVPSQQAPLHATRRVDQTRRTPTEKKKVEGAHKTSRFLDFWTLKEAYLKAVGLGIAADLTTVSFTLADDRDIAVSAPPDLRRPASSFLISRRPGHWRVALVVFGGIDARDIEITLCEKRSF